MDQPKIGVYVCDCGVNIGATVNTAEVVKFAQQLPNVAVARQHKYTCSEPGQTLIKEDIENIGINRVVVASCSPRMHEITFQNTVAEAVEPGEFREDLYYRMAEINVCIPPLRERESDILLLARTILDQLNLELGKSMKGFTDGAMAAIEAHSWPGNVRELKNRVKPAIIMANDSRITPQDLELEAPLAGVPTFNLREVREQAERQTVLRALTHADGKITKGADLLGISRPTIYDLIRKHDVKVRGQLRRRLGAYVYN